MVETGESVDGLGCFLAIEREVFFFRLSEIMVLLSSSESSSDEQKQVGSPQPLTEPSNYKEQSTYLQEELSIEWDCRFEGLFGYPCLELSWIWNRLVLFYYAKKSTRWHFHKSSQK